jgi:hypothetical protein
MSTSNQGRGRNSRGRGYQPGRGRGKPKTEGTTRSAKDGEIKFTPYGTWGGKTSVTYDTVKDHILQFIQKTYKDPEDVVNSLREMEKVDLSSKMPQLERATNPDDDL